MQCRVGYDVDARYAGMSAHNVIDTGRSSLYGLEQLCSCCPNFGVYCVIQKGIDSDNGKLGGTADYNPSLLFLQGRIFCVFFL